MWKIRKILVPTDFSDESLKALRYATEFVQTLLGVEVLVVHVVTPPAYAVSPLAGVTVPAMYENVAEVCSERLGELLRREVPEGVAARSIVRDGQPWDEIAAVAREEGVDLILVATHGYTGLKRLMMGSTAERIVRVAPCPVLTVRDREREFVRGQTE